MPQTKSRKNIKTNRKYACAENNLLYDFIYIDNILRKKNLVINRHLTKPPEGLSVQLYIQT